MAAIFLKGVAAARGACSGGTRRRNAFRGTPRDFATTNCDALVMMAETLSASAAGGTQRPFPDRDPRRRLRARRRRRRHVRARRRAALAPETARRIACDASIVHAVHDAVDRLVGTGRKAPAIPASTRRAVHARDRGCRFPGCGGRAFTNIHHIRHRARFGGNEMTNLVELCWFHHRLVHEGGWNLRFDDTGAVIAIRPNGNVLARPRPARGHDPHAVERDNRRAGHRDRPDYLHSTLVRRPTRSGRDRQWPRVSRRNGREELNLPVASRLI